MKNGIKLMYVDKYKKPCYLVLASRIVEYEE